MDTSLCISRSSEFDSVLLDGDDNEDVVFSNSFDGFFDLEDGNLCDVSSVVPNESQIENKPVLSLPTSAPDPNTITTFPLYSNTRRALVEKHFLRSSSPDPTGTAGDTHLSSPDDEEVSQDQHAGHCGTQHVLATRRDNQHAEKFPRRLNNAEVESRRIGASGLKQEGNQTLPENKVEPVSPSTAFANLEKGILKGPGLTEELAREFSLPKGIFEFERWANVHQGLLICNCGDSEETITYTFDANVTHRSGKCTWDCCDLDWDTVYCPAATIRRPKQSYNHSSVLKAEKTLQASEVEENSDFSDFKLQILNAMQESGDETLSENEKELVRLHTKIHSLEKSIAETNIKAAAELKIKEAEGYQRITLLQISHKRLKQQFARKLDELASSETNRSLQAARVQQLEKKQEDMHAQMEQQQRLFSMQLKSKEDEIAGMRAQAEQKQRVVSKQLKSKEEEIAGLRAQTEHKQQGTIGKECLMRLSIEDLQDLVKIHLEGVSASQEALASKLLEENRILKDSQLCSICLDKQTAVVLVPCGHQILCEDCASKVDTCPVDRMYIEKKVKVYSK